MRQYHVYILQCSDTSYYVGVTNNLERRLSEHNDGLNKKCYTHSRRPVIIMYAEEFQYIRDAISWEKQLKGWGRKKKEALFIHNWNEIKKLASSGKRGFDKLNLTEAGFDKRNLTEGEDAL